MSRENLDDLSEENIQKHIDIKQPQAVLHHHFGNVQTISHTSSHAHALHPHKESHGESEKDAKFKAENQEPIQEVDPVKESEGANVDSKQEID